jgi:GNAT superfamily N-acetyltransferase
MQEWQRILLTAAEGCRSWQASAQVRINESANLLSIRTGLPDAYFNNLIRLPGYSSGRELFESTAATQFIQGKMPFVIWSAAVDEPPWLDQFIQDQAFTGSTQATLMWRLLTGASQLDPSADVSISKINNNNQLEIWSRLVTSLHPMSDDIFNGWLRLYRSFTFVPQPDWYHFIATKESRPVAGMSLFLGKESAAISNVVTLPSYRKQGIANRLIQHAEAFCRDRGYNSVTLLASESAASLYQKRGYRADGKINFFLKQFYF